jgi:hypothetical protein
MSMTNGRSPSRGNLPVPPNPLDWSAVADRRYAPVVT